jgi:hypothetical protein
MNSGPDRMLRLYTKAVIRVGNGRGFLIATQPDRMVITAAHCLPSLPPAGPHTFTEERTYQNLLGPLGEEPTVWAECLFVDPISNLAVLASPDNQLFFDEAHAFEELIASRPSPRIGSVREQSFAVRALSLAGEWLPATAEVISWTHQNLGITPEEIIESGMSGSPVLTTDGRAVSVVSTSRASPVLDKTLPPWLKRRRPRAVIQSFGVRDWRQTGENS